SWTAAGKETDSIKSISAEELSSIQQSSSEAAILDVRKDSEHQSEHILGAVNAPLDYINESMLKVSKDKTWYVHCAGGYRSMVFASILKARGYNNLVDVAGGFSAIKKTGSFQLTQYVCPTTLL
ncbi:MAG: rhodanese-like domain-containing protein, partial [Sphingomonadales bacterium]